MDGQDDRPRLYLDTSVYGGCFDPEFEVASKQVISLVRTGTVVAVVSSLVLEELSQAPLPVYETYNALPLVNLERIEFNVTSRLLFDAYWQAGFVTRRAIVDARHVATATVDRAFAIVSWNFRDIVHPDKIQWYNAINIAFGYPALKILSPREVIRLVD